MSVKAHIHTYVRFKSRPGYYKCNDPHCTHFASRDLILDKASRCPECKEEFILDYDKLRRARPLCDNCANTAKARLHRASKQIFENLFDIAQGE